MIVSVHGRNLEVRIHNSMHAHRQTLSGENLNKIAVTLRRLPHQHLGALARVEIRQRARAGGSTNQIGGRNRRIPPEQSSIPREERSYFIVLDIDSFESSWNNKPNGLLYTLLHEVGHVADWSTGAFEWIQNNDRPGYNAICNRVHNGKTENNQEKFADAYADLFFYQGEPRGNVRSVEAVWGTPLFDGLRSEIMIQNSAIA